MSHAVAGQRAFQRTEDAKALRESIVGVYEEESGDQDNWAKTKGVGKERGGP